MIEDAERQRLPTEARDDLEVIRIHAHRVARITQGLLSFARHRPGEKVRVDVNRMVEDTVLLVAKQVQSEGIVLRVDLAPELPPVQGDPTLLGQVLLNLLNNARDAVLDADGAENARRAERDQGRPGRLFDEACRNLDRAQLVGAAALAAHVVTLSARSERHRRGFRLYARKRVVGWGAP